MVAGCTKHPACSRSVSQLPRRVIDVGTSRIDVEPKLYEANGERGCYIALSHCWGTKNTFTTTSDTLETRLQGLPFSELPKTFRDAIFITRMLSVRYLWVDSLCILQDEDK